MPFEIGDVICKFSSGFYAAAVAISAGPRERMNFNRAVLEPLADWPVTVFRLPL
jgi:hypothetical protein